MFLEINHLEKVFRTRFSKEETHALQDVDFNVDLMKPNVEALKEALN